MEKLKAVKRSKSNWLLFIQPIQHGVFFTLFMLISHHCAPTVESSIKLFFSVCLPSVCSTVTSSKFIFIVANAIIIFLVGESRLSKASSKLDICGEYSIQSRRLQSLASLEVKEREDVSREKPLLVEEIVQEKDDKIGAREKEEEAEEEEIVKRECEDLVEEGDEEVIGVEEKEEIVEEVVVVVERECEDLVEEDEEVIGMEEEEEEEGVPPAEEVNRRVEDFIAMVNMERRKEAMMMLICYKP